MSNLPTAIELLAPAKDLECGMAAITHGADAVYIGAAKFGARAAAGNSLEDIGKLVAFAHGYRAKVYVTLNTILRDSELPETEQLVWNLHRIGVDALIVQDMGLLQLNIPPIPLHASTQADNRSAEKVSFLSKAGFRQIVLARELSLQEIARIHREVPDARLEVFVHGALCVSYSGQCYVSEACFHRSANRGECAQFCRMAFDMVDADGKIVARKKHLLSLKDLNQSDVLEEILDAGAVSLKIEGRLKDVSYVKNVTAFYRRRLDAIFRCRKEYVRSSSGTEHFSFEPQLDKTFSRGSTHYFLHGRTTDIFSFDTPKSLGEEMGVVKEVGRNSFTVAGLKGFNNGDGLCFIDDTSNLCGFRLNRVEGNRLYPAKMPAIQPRMKIYRNYCQSFENVMQGKTAERKIRVDLTMRPNPFGFTLSADDEDGCRACLSFPYTKQEARIPQGENLRFQLGKLGNTAFEASDIDVADCSAYFIPSSVVNAWRRQLVELLAATRRVCYRQVTSRVASTQHDYPQDQLTYLGNVMNRQAHLFYASHGVRQIAPAFEAAPPKGGDVAV
ncbi:MAG: U32 family peptidase, partial [Bacteroidales bacterium]|nr:U32 family peptidase [Bacteroidales bacterium]